VRQQLRDKNLPTGGEKQELVERLVEARRVAEASQLQAARAAPVEEVD